jgi:2-dehydro-3-deoxygalactonokinase
LEKWIAVDWGTSTFRAYLVQDNKVSDTIETKDGMKFVKSHLFEQTLLTLIDRWLDNDKITEILASGMVGSKQGWEEAPYQKTPCNLKNLNYITPSLKDNRISLKIFSGVCQINQPDVMRGEETQIAGFLNENPNFNGSICLPGTHSKWVEIKNNNIIKFKTFMTGELFEIISKNSVLIHSVKAEKIDKMELLKSVDKILQKPELFSNALFQLRADDLINSKGPSIYKSRLSGYLLAIELLGSVEFWKNSDIVLIGNPDLTAMYQFVFNKKVKSIKKFLSRDMILKGLKNFKKNFQ